MHDAISRATQSQPINFYIGSCPDYSHDGEAYTHEYLGSDVPLLTRVHLDYDREIINVLESQSIPYKMTIMVADVEATDKIFCKRFTNNDQNEFLRRCESSVSSTEKFVEKIGLSKKVISSSFFNEFGRERFINYQERYKEVLKKRYKFDDSFRMRVNGDLVSRMDMYKNMYPDVFQGNINFLDRTKFLIDRTLRTMAQYLTLGRLIGENGDLISPMIICHPTRNIGMFNDRNKFVLPEDGPQPQPTIPVFEMKRRVY